MSRKTHTKKRPTPAPTKPAALRAVFPVRTPTAGPEFITEQQMNAAYAARLHGLPLIPITAWLPQPNGAVRAHLPGGTSLTHGPSGFTALTLHQAATTAEDTQTLNVTDLRNDTDQPKEHPTS